MPAVRYIALAALVVWMGLTVAAARGELSGVLGERFREVAIACGAVILVALFVMKFVGPPPRAFMIRAGIVFIMLASSVSSWFSQTETPALLGMNAALGFLLLYWYSNE